MLHIMQHYSAFMSRKCDMYILIYLTEPAAIPLIVVTDIVHALPIALRLRDVRSIARRDVTAQFGKLTHFAFWAFC